MCTFAGRNSRALLPGVTKGLRETAVSKTKDAEIETILLRPMNTPLSPVCTWCSAGQIRLTDDHVFPRAIGGTKELVVPSCVACQQVLSTLEFELSRRSPFALCTIENGPSGRDKRKPRSGAIQAEYILVRNSLDGYSETHAWAGAKPPEQLSSIEIEPSGKHLARRRGGSPEEHLCLIRALSEILDSGSIDKIEFNTSALHEIGDDPDFWPRIARRHDGKLFVRARDKPEADFFISELRAFLSSPQAYDYSSWRNSEVEGGTAHSFCVRSDATKVHRALVKIVFSLAFLNYGDFALRDDSFLRIRDYVIKGSGFGQEYVIEQFREFKRLNCALEHHSAFVGPWQDRMTGAVNIYGVCFGVDFGSVPSRLAGLCPVIATCRTNGTRCQILEGDIAHQSIRLLLSQVKSDFHRGERNSQVQLAENG
jgi:hypothetical protein